MNDVLAIQRLVADFALRDRNDWQGVAKLFAPGALLQISWYDGPIEGFLEASEQAAARGAPPTKHWFGYPRVDQLDDRAVAETDVQIVVRAGKPEAAFDVCSWARFIDLLERHDGRWQIVKRTAVYERDRLDPVDPAHPVPLPRAELAAYPAAYRHLAFLLSQVGLRPALNTVVAATPAEDELHAQARRWLAGPSFK